MVSALLLACCFSADPVSVTRASMSIPGYQFVTTLAGNTSPDGQFGKADVCGSFRLHVKGFISDQELAWRIAWVLCKRSYWC